MSGGASAASLGRPHGLLHPRRQWPRVLPPGPLGDRPQHPASAPGLFPPILPSTTHSHTHTCVPHPAQHPHTHTHTHPPHTHTVHTTHSPTPRSERKPNSSQHNPVTRHCMKGDLQRKGSLSRREISLLGLGTDNTLWSRLVPAEGTACVGAPRAHAVLPRCSWRVVRTRKSPDPDAAGHPE